MRECEIWERERMQFEQQAETVPGQNFRSPYRQNQQDRKGR